MPSDRVYWFVEAIRDMHYHLGPTHGHPSKFNSCKHDLCQKAKRRARSEEMETATQEESRREKSYMAELNSTGDTKIMWDSDNADEVALAKEQFTNALAKGFLAFRTDKKGEKGEQIREFDPNAERIILTRPLKGG